MSRHRPQVHLSPEGLLTITGERKQETKEEGEAGKWRRVERWAGSFTRSLQLPPSADSTRIAAKMENGVLMLEIPKLPEPKQQLTEIPIA